MKLTDSVTDALNASLNQAFANTARKYKEAFWCDMSSAERIGVLTHLVETGYATDAEECALLDLVDPWQVYA